MNATFYLVGEDSTLYPISEGPPPPGVAIQGVAYDAGEGLRYVDVYNGGHPLFEEWWGYNPLA